MCNPLCSCVGMCEYRGWKVEEGGGATYWSKKDNSMNDGGINVRVGEGDMSPELLLMAMVSCYLCNGSISNLRVYVCMCACVCARSRPP